MTIHPLISHLVDYTFWANTRFVERLQQEPEEVLDREVTSSFPSLRATLLHIRDAECAWTHRLQERAPIPWPAGTSTTLDTVLDHSGRLRELVLAATDQWLEGQVVYADLRGNRHEQVRWQMILHCCNHGTQHRGQLITMMRTLGLDRIPANDMIVFQRSLRKG